jgi:hypothetical protein
MTPNGLADALTDVDGEKVFLEPHEQTIPFKEFSKNLRERPEGEVFYLSEQNDNLRQSI